MKKAIAGWWVGVTLGLVCFALVLALIGFVYLKGIEAGRSNERADVERLGGGRQVELRIDGKWYSGWLR